MIKAMKDFQIPMRVEVDKDAFLQGGSHRL